MIDDVIQHLTNLQSRICAELETLDGKASFVGDAWDRPGGGGGESRVIAGGGVFVMGHIPEQSIAPSGGSAAVST